MRRLDKYIIKASKHYSIILSTIDGKDVVNALLDPTKSIDRLFVEDLLALSPFEPKHLIYYHTNSIIYQLSIDTIIDAWNNKPTKEIEAFIKYAIHMFNLRLSVVTEDDQLY